MRQLNDQMSDLESYAFSCMSSGGGITKFVFVNEAWARVLERPKSRRLTVFDVSRKTLGMYY
jgi:hypothetical protein